jgi:phosphatidylserine/phosphatidylglycerophosphate/cardiolipin synthase-like enzyme
VANHPSALEKFTELHARRDYRHVIEVRTLSDGGQTATEVAGWIADWIAGARTSLDLAQYHVELAPETAAIVGGAVRAAHARGVRVRIAYNLDFRNPIPVPPPPNTDDDLVLGLGVESRSIAGVPDLMHHKFVVRDGNSVWTGSMNWTDDSFSRQENVLATVHSERLAYAYTLGFEQLWETGDVAHGGRVEPRPVDVGSARVRPWFSPRYGDDRSHRIAKYIGRARRRVRVASPVITAAPILGTLAQVAAEESVDLAGVVDLTQMREVHHQWTAVGGSNWKVPLMETVLGHAAFAGKASTPWRPEGSLHDFMHAKVVVADDVVFLGSFNLSRSGEENAEDVLEIHDASVADRLAAFVDEVRARYPRAALLPPAPSATSPTPSESPTPPEGAEAPLHSP